MDAGGGPSQLGQLLSSQGLHHRSAFGIGAKKERWKIETKFPELVKIASQLLTENGFLIINTYSPKLKEENIYNIVKEYFPTKKIQVDKLSLKTTTGKTLEYGELTRVC